jgi:hypothetical protein
MDEYAFPVHLVQEPLSFEYIAFCKPLDTEAFSYVVPPLALVSITVCVLHDSLALLAAHNPFTVVHPAVTV